MKKTFVFGLMAAFAMTSTASADVIVDSLDFSTAGQGSTHDTSGFDPIDASPISGGVAPNDWSLSFPAPSSDGSTNEFVTAGGVMRVQDWGGDGTVTASPWVATGDGSVDISGAASTIGTDAFNSVGTEGITWFYSINSGTPVEVFLGETELGGPVAAGTDVGNTFSSVAISSGDSLSYGFTVNVNGGGDGVEVSSLTVDFTAVPEPSSIALLGLVGMAGSIRRRK